jgi:predicted hydrocarbon binding protein
MAMLSTLSQVEGRAVSVLLEEFGEFIISPLMETYGYIVNPSWKTLDLIEHAEEKIHTVIRTTDTNATPPAILCTRSAPNEVIVHYNSPRKMCRFMRGMAKGIARHYHEQVSMSETSCMLENASECVLVIRTVN